MSEEITNINVDHRDRSPILVAIGALLLLIGIAAALLGPAEMYCFYLFSEGGRFHYEGFGFGSFMFGNIACQIIGYYVIAAVFIPLGYGHVRMRRWVSKDAWTCSPMFSRGPASSGSVGVMRRSFRRARP